MGRYSKLEKQDVHKGSTISEVKAEQNCSSLEEVLLKNGKTIGTVSKLVNLMSENPSYFVFSYLIMEQLC